MPGLGARELGEIGRELDRLVEDLLVTPASAMPARTGQLRRVFGLPAEAA
ncbi:hypothetical protein [Amycolatopsis sp. H20-H5]|nr:hypothetical protein [Amycolatopsis sp. H20-H5]MEC3977137.1 hypothetical protein [Amycolatopsis sp. H20-H5]